MAPAVPIEFSGQKESRKFSTAQVMGKSRKPSSKGLPAGFLPDYGHAVDTTAEFEGFGSSGRADTEMTASDDSYGRKRKCISLNVDGGESFGVPVQVLSLSKLSGIERRDLKYKLRKELEQVQGLRRRLASLSLNIVALSPSGDIRSCNGGQKRPPVDSTFGSSGVVKNGKKRVAPSRSGARSKKGNSGCPEPASSAGSYGTTNTMLMKQCATLLKQLMSHQHGNVFNTPVDVVKWNIPDYFDIIKHPMDLGTVKRKLDAGEYSSPLGFAADVRLTFSNAMTYNPPGNNVHLMADTISKNFEKRWKAIEKKISMVLDVQEVPSYTYAPADETPPLKKMKVMPNDSLEKPSSAIWRQKLSMDLEALLGELPENIIEFLREQSSGADQTAEDEIEIDIDALGDDSLLKLRKLLDDYTIEKQKKQGKAEPCEIELHNVSGISNSSLPQSKAGNEAIDEDVDIVGGNDLPISSFPPVEIEKDAAHRNSRCSSPSSSSSESGSSSSDLDTGSSSESECDAAKASGLDKLGNGGIDQSKGAAGNPDTGNCLASGGEGGHSQLNCEPQPNSNDNAGPHEEEESAPPERQVSPEKLFRAALLRNRFADTILKAQEKTLEKDDKRDPEKLRLQREELERRLKEEKAKLQAEARAVEEAQKKAEAKAAADAKKRREQERERARQALQEMEKNVDINDNRWFMEDLELLQAANDESVPSFMEAASPDPSENALGSFNFHSSKALEQLGLYMKDDDEEEDEESKPELEQEPAPVPEPEPMTETKIEPEPVGEPEGQPEPEPHPQPHPQRSVPPDDVEEGEID